ncbi:hypothetical protein HYU07_02560, partial [Candidatus Woesearchaeota archaeon]|nr:hypothetical protein [Candidatus Woesearchaeota archaeon]
MKKIKVIQFGAGEVGFRNAVYMNEMDNIEVLVCEKFFSSELKLLNERKIPIFASDKKAYDDLKKNGTKLKGIVTDLAGRIDVADDATKDAKANFQLYRELGCRYIIGNGMEKHKDFDASFSSLGNFNEARGKYKIRVVSCNTNGLIRVLDAISKEFGLKEYEVFLIRRSTDPGRKGAVINDLEYSSEPSHHAEDVSTVRHDFKGTSTAAVSSVNRYHLHDILIYVKKMPKNAEQVYNVLEA